MIPVGRTPEPVVTHLVHAAGQNLLEETPNEFVGIERHDFRFRRAASPEVLEGPSMAGGHLVAKLFEIGRAVPPQDIGHFDHGGSTADQPRVITWLTWAWTSAMVLWVRCL